MYTGYQPKTVRLAPTPQLHYTFVFMRSRIRPLILILILLIPIIIGVAWTLSDPSPAQTAHSENSEEPVTTAAQEQQDLTATRRAAGEATTQAGFLVTGTTELANGSQLLNDATGQLNDGAKQAVNGSQQLADGMVQLQSATGELGAGANQLADGVQQAVEQIQGLAAMQGQIMTFIDEADKELGKYPGQDAKEMRAKLGDLRTQVNNFKFDGETADKLNQLRSGSRELADQLGKPGSPFHDGVFTATDASKQLAAGLRELGDGANQLNGATGELKAGADRIKGMADQNKTKVQAIQQTIPTGVAAAGNTEQTPQPAATGGIGSVGLVIGIFVMMAASALWLVAKPNSGIWTPLLAVASIAIIGVILLVAFGSSGTRLAAQCVVLALAASAGAFLGRAMLSLFGQKIGRGVLLASILIQTAVVALMLGTESIVIAFFPLFYTMRGLLANPGIELIMSCLVLAMFSLAGMTVVRFMGRKPKTEKQENETDIAEEEPVEVLA